MANAVTRKSSSTSAQSVVAENNLRRGLVLVNDDANRAYVLLGQGTVSATNYSLSLAQNENAFLAGCILPVSVIYGTAGSGGINATEW